MKSNYLKILVFFVSLCAVQSLRAQNSSSTKPVLGEIKEYQYDLGQIYHTVPDSGIDQVELYNPMRQKYRLYQDEGNIGSPAQPLIFTVRRNTGFQLGNQTMEQYYVRPADATYYQARRPITRIQYVQGSKELLFLKILHTQNIKPRWNAGVNFSRINSLGFYTNQKTSIWSTQLFTSYHSRNQQYQLLSNINWNKGYVEENGGLQSDSAFEAVTSVNKQVAMNLQGQTTTGGGGPRNYFRNTSFYVKQYWSFGQHEKKISPADTQDIFYAHARLAHTLEVDGYSWLYKDKQLLNKNFYPTFYFDTTQTYDSIHLFQVQNTFSFFSGRYAGNLKERKILFAPALRHEYIEVAQRSMNNVYNNLLAMLDIFSNANRGSRWSYRGQNSYCFSGYNSGDYKLDHELSHSLPALRLGVGILLQQWAPDFVQNRFVSNHYVWMNDFSKTALRQLTLRLNTSKWPNNMQVRVRYIQSDNLIYYSQDGTPKQLNKTIQVTVADVSKTIQLGNFFLSNIIWVQQTDGKRWLRLPEVGAFERFYYQRRLFKKVMLAQMGIDMFYNSSYYAQSFQPVTRQFQLQDSVKTGNYATFDVFFNMQIKRASLFFKMDHVNAGLNGNRYYSSPHQPMPGRAFRLGIIWRMYD